jgi:hypothetical protein
MTTQPLAPIRWVYSLKDYRSLFRLTHPIVSRRILEFSAVVSSFNVQMTALGYQVVSASPLYTLEQDSMEEHVTDRMQQLKVEQVACMGENGSLPGDTSRVVRRWQKMSDIFLTDYSVGVRTGRYAFSGDTHLAFADQSFDLALSVAVEKPESDLPVLIGELARVSHEFRMVLNIHKGGSPGWLGVALDHLRMDYWQVTFKSTKTLYGEGQWVLMRAKKVACALKD